MYQNVDFDIHLISGKKAGWKNKAHIFACIQKIIPIKETTWNKEQPANNMQAAATGLAVLELPPSRTLFKFLLPACIFNLWATNRVSRWGASDSFLNVQVLRYSSSDWIYHILIGNYYWKTKWQYRKSGNYCVRQNLQIESPAIKMTDIIRN